MKSHPAASAGIEFVGMYPPAIGPYVEPEYSSGRQRLSGSLQLLMTRLFRQIILCCFGWNTRSRNLGTILRIADWFGLPSLVVSEDTVEEFNPKGRASGDGIALQNQDPSHKAGYLSCGIHRRKPLIRYSRQRWMDGLIQKPVSEGARLVFGK